MRVLILINMKLELCAEYWFTGDDTRISAIRSSRFHPVGYLDPSLQQLGPYVRIEHGGVIQVANCITLLTNDPVKGQ